MLIVIVISPVVIFGSICGALDFIVICTPTDMVGLKWFGRERKTDCLQRQSLATQDNTPLSVATTPSLNRCVSVYEPHAAYYAQLGRIMVTYDVKQNTWHYPCARSRRSCLRKYIAK